MAVLALYILAGTPLVPFHPDESTQIFMSHDYAYQFIERDLSKIRYSDPPQRDTEQELRLLNGTINKYLIGLAWHLNGFNADDLNEQWDWGADWDYNLRAGHLPALDLLHVARWPSALLLAAGVIVIFALGWQLGGRPVAYFASLYYALNPALLLNGRRAMMEGSQIFFALLVVLAGVWFVRRYSWRAVLLLGVAAGFALASKHTTVFTVAPVFAICIVLILARRQTRPLGKLFAAGVIGLAIFYALNPAWWGNPISRATTVLELRQDLLTTQTEVFGHYEHIVDQSAGFARQTLMNLTQYYEVSGWDALIGDQIAHYESSPWHGVSIGGSVIGGLVMLLLVGFGLLALWRHRHRQVVSGRWLIGGWALAVSVFTLVLTPLEWQRYYVPVYPALGLLAALGLAHVIGYSRVRWLTG
ncbi:MAG: glycosyltransferase family 39 protein [Anaerolineae bacterium]|nr:glycosyltransferase family 39 protein [Anaerolineae bacterium]